MNKTEIMAQFATSQDDTGSTEVQCALLTNKINNLTIHLKKNKKDFQTRHGLIKMVVHRRRLLENLKKKDSSRYAALMTKLNLHKN
jgi:small subunit ribosomal protein S15